VLVATAAVVAMVIVLALTAALVLVVLVTAALAGLVLVLAGAPVVVVPPRSSSVGQREGGSATASDEAQYNQACYDMSAQFHDASLGFRQQVNWAGCLPPCPQLDPIEFKRSCSTALSAQKISQLGQVVRLRILVPCQVPCHAQPPTRELGGS
jgi:hypothetical protein